MYDLVVLGGGSGGWNVALSAARVGARVAVIEKHRPGEKGHYSASVPSKALLHAARLAHTIRSAGRFGIKTPAPEVDFPAVMERVRSLAADRPAPAPEALGVEVFHGSPAFEAYDTITIDGQTRIHAQRFVIATGSRPARPKAAGLEDAGYLTTETVWDLTERPETLVIIGGGPSGVEFAQAFARLGSKVKLLADSDHLLPREDPEVSDFLKNHLAAEGITIKTGVELTQVSVRDGQKVVSFKDKGTNDTFEAAGTEIFVATGRLANEDGLNLHALGIRSDPHTGIEVNEYLQTYSPRIYALGDVLNRHDYAHAAEREAAVVFQNAVLRIPRKIDYSTLPWATFTDPEVATVGLSEAAARAQHPEARVFRAEYADLDRARIDGKTEGFAKLVATPAGKVLGATIVGQDAALILQEIVLAMEHGLTLADIAATTHIYPTYAGMTRTLANQYTQVEGGLLQTAMRWFLGYRPRTNTDSGAPATQTSEHAHGH